MLEGAQKADIRQAKLNFQLHTEVETLGYENYEQFRLLTIGCSAPRQCKQLRLPAEHAEPPCQSVNIQPHTECPSRAQCG